MSTPIAPRSATATIAVHARFNRHYHLSPTDRPAFDYSEWIDQSKRQTAAQLLQQTHIDLAIAESVGGHYVVSTPFRARLLDRICVEHGNPGQALFWADIPILAGSPPPALAAAAQAEDAVEAMRDVVRRGFAAVPDPRRIVRYA